MKPLKKTYSPTTQTIKIKWFFILLIILSGSGSTKRARAENPILSYGTIGNTEILYQTAPSQLEDSSVFTDNLKKVRQALHEVLELPLFHTLPPHALLIDPTWTKSGGFFSPELRHKNRPVAVIGFSNIGALAQTKRVVAHELAHLLFFQANQNEDSWVSEGAALLAEYLVTGTFGKFIEYSFQYPEVTLTGSFDANDESYHDRNGTHQAAQYGNVQLYFYYLYRNCNQEVFLNKLFEKKNSGKTLLDSVLETSYCPVGRNFKESFERYSIAKAMQDFTDPLKYVLYGAMKMDVLEHPALLEPFSETLYRLPEGDHCKAGEVPWGLRRCIRIRF